MSWNNFLVSLIFLIVCHDSTALDCQTGWGANIMSAMGDAQSRTCDPTLGTAACRRIEAHASTAFSGQQLSGPFYILSCVNRDLNCSNLSEAELKQIGQTTGVTLPIPLAMITLTDIQTGCCDTYDCNIDPLSDWTGRSSTAMPPKLVTEPATTAMVSTNVHYTPSPEPVTALAMDTSTTSEVTSKADARLFCQVGVTHEMSFLPKQEPVLSPCNDSLLHEPVCFRIEASVSLKALDLQGFTPVSYSSCEERTNCTSITCDSFKTKMAPYLPAFIKAEDIETRDCKFACCTSSNCNNREVQFIDALTTTRPTTTTPVINNTQAISTTSLAAVATGSALLVCITVANAYGIVNVIA